MINTFTTLETLKTSDGKTIVFNPDQLGEFFKRTYEENYMNLSKEEKEEGFLVDQQYGDLLIKMWKEPMHNLLNPVTGATWILQDEQRNPIEEYENILTLTKDEDISQEDWDSKIERLRHHKEWFESQNN